MSNFEKVEAGCEVAQCNYVIRYDNKFGDIKCGKMFYASWSGVDLFGYKAAAQVKAQSDMAQHKLDCLHY